MGDQICPQRQRRKHLRTHTRRHAPPTGTRTRTHRSQLPRRHGRRRNFRASARLPLCGAPRQPYGWHRQQPAGRLALQLLRRGHRRQTRLLRRHHAHRPGTGSAHEASRRCRPRPLAPPPPRHGGKELGSHLHGPGALYGEILQLHPRGGAGRPPWRPDDDSINQAPRLRGLHRRQDDSRQSYRRKCVCAHRRRLHACRRSRKPFGGK